MKLSTRGRYGLRALLDLAVHYKQGPIALGEIANRQDISANYLEQVFSDLRKAGIVKSVKGPQGGYCLLNETREISVKDILKVLEGELVLAEEQIQEDSPDTLKKVQQCLQACVWNKLNQNLSTILTEITLEDLVRDYETRENTDTIMYYI